MPTYEYGCKDCGHQFEEFQKMSDAPLVKCPSCGQDTLEKLISAAAFVLKGGGWAKDNYNPDPKKGNRTENQRIDRLEKAIKDDKAKTAAASSSPTKTSSSE